MKYDFFDVKINDEIKTLEIDFDNREDFDNIIDFDVTKSIANNNWFFDIAKHVANETNWFDIDVCDEIKSEICNVANLIKKNENIFVKVSLKFCKE